MTTSRILHIQEAKNPSDFSSTKTEINALLKRNTLNPFLMKSPTSKKLTIKEQKIKEYFPGLTPKNRTKFIPLELNYYNNFPKNSLQLLNRREYLIMIDQMKSKMNNPKEIKGLIED